MKDKNNKIMTTENNQTELANLLKPLNFKLIKELSGIFDISKLDSDGTPNIVTKNKTVIVFDNSDFNSTYIVDMVNEYFVERQYPESVGIKNIDFVYVNDPIIRRELFHPNCTENNVKTLETEILHAGIIIVNPVKKHIVSFQETEISVLDNTIICGALNWLWSEITDIKVLGKIS